jgi:dipeptidyl aminopeptidase/acylaminoacyl peptidase
LPGALAQIRDSFWGPMIEEQLRKLSPIHHISKDMPPFLFIHGTADRVVPYEQSVRMCEQMRKAGVVCEVILIPGGTHGMIYWESHPSYKQQMIRWLKTWTTPRV